MAYTQGNEIKTRISLKYDTLKNWQDNNPTLLTGEVAFAEVPTVEGSTLQPVMMKVGPGAFNDLDWVSAKAADVYTWAKQAGLNVDTTEITDGKYVSGLKWEGNQLKAVTGDLITDIANNGTSTKGATTAAIKTYVDAEVQKAVSGGVEGLATEEYVNTAIEDLSKEGGAIKEVADGLADLKTKVEDEDGALERANAAYTLAESKTTMAEVEAKDYATNTALNDVKATAEAAVTDADLATELAPYAKTEDVNTTLADYAKTSEVNTALEPYAKTADVEATYATKEALKATDDVAKDAKARIDGFLDGTAEAESAIDTLVEIQQYMTTDTDAFTALSSRVTTVEGELDTYGDIVTHNVDEFATAAQGTKADSAVQEVKEGSTNGTIAVDGTNVAVHGLGSAAYENVAKFADAEATETALNGKMDKLPAISDRPRFLLPETRTGEDGMPVFTGNVVMSQYGESDLATTSQLNGKLDKLIGEGHQQFLFPEVGEDGKWTGKLVASGIYETDYKKAQSLIEETGAVNQTITKITQNPDGVIDVEFDDIAITADQVGGLATIAQTGNVNDLIQTANTYVLFNCGSATDVI